LPDSATPAARQAPAVEGFIHLDMFAAQGRRIGLWYNSRAW